MRSDRARLMCCYAFVQMKIAGSRKQSEFYAAAAPRIVRAQVIPDPDSGPTKVLHVSDLPEAPADRLRHLHERARELEDHVRIAGILEAELEHMVEAERQVLFANARSQMSQADRDTVVVPMPSLTPQPRLDPRPVAPPWTAGRSGSSALPPSPAATSAPAAAAAVPPHLYEAFDDDDNDEEESLAVSSRGAAAAGAGGGTAAPRELLWVQVVSAVGIPAADINGKTDPFVALSLEPAPVAIKGQPPPLRQRLETRRCPTTLEPIWGECFSFSLQVTRRMSGRVDVVLRASPRLHARFFLSTAQSAHGPGGAATGGAQAAAGPPYLRARVMDHDAVSAAPCGDALPASYHSSDPPPPLVFACADVRCRAAGGGEHQPREPARRQGLRPLVPAAVQPWLQAPPLRLRAAARPQDDGRAVCLAHGCAAHPVAGAGRHDDHPEAHSREDC